MVVIKYKKMGEGMFFSHFNLIRIWTRIFAVSHVEIQKKSDVSRQKRLYFSNPTRVGVESEAEYVMIDALEDASDVEDKIKHNLPSFMELVYVKEAKGKFNITSVNNCARYVYRFEGFATRKGKIKDFFEREKIEIEVSLHSEIKEMDIKDRIFSYEFLDDGVAILAGVNDKSVRADELGRALMKFIKIEGTDFEVVKTGLFVLNGNANLKNIDDIIV